MVERCEEYRKDAKQHLKQKDVLMAAHYYEEAAKCFEELEEFQEAANNYLRAASHHLQIGSVEDAVLNFESAAICFENIGEQESKKECLQNAMDSCLEMEESSQVYNKIGFLLTLMDRFDEALEYYETTLEQYRISSKREDRSFMEQVSQAYAGACYCHVRLAEQQGETWGLEKALELSEEYRGRKLALFLQEDGVDDLVTHGRKWRMEYDVVTEFLYNLQDIPTVLYYLVEPRVNQVVILFFDSYSSSSSSSSHVRLNVPMSSLEELKTKYQAALENRDRKLLEEVVNKLDNLILPDMSDLTPETEFLLVIPDPLLQWVPWELLGCSKGSCLGLKFGLARSYSLDLARIAMTRGFEWLKLKKLEEWRNLSAVLFGNPTLDLLFAEEEVTEVAKLLEKRNVTTRLFQEEQAEFSAFSNVCRYKLVDIVHFAGHGTLDKENPSASELKFFDRGIQSSDVERTKFWSAPIVILSACQSGLATSIGEEILGFIRGFIAAGATSILATNWMIHDDSSRDLILTFYEGILSQKNVAIALRDARRQIYEKYDGDPFDWAAYILYGDPYRTLIAGREITEDDVHFLFGYVGNPDETLSQYTLRALDYISETTPQILTSALTDGLAWYDDWNWNYGRVMEILNDSIMDGFFNLRPIEEAMCEILRIVEKEESLEHKIEVRGLAFEALTLIADRYDEDGDLEGLDHALEIIVLALVDSNSKISKSAEHSLRGLGINRTDLVAKHLAAALEDEENFVFAKNLEVVLRLLHRLIPNLENLDPVVDVLAEISEELYDSGVNKRIVDKLDKRLREKLLSQLEIRELREFATQQGIESTDSKKKKEFVRTLLDRLKESSLEKFKEELSS